MTATAPSFERRRPTAAVQLVELTRIQLAHWRWSWISAVATGVVAPLITVIGLGRAAAVQNTASVGYLYVGSLILGLCFENQQKVAGHFSFQRQIDGLGYYAALPIRQPALITATSLAFFLLSLPAMIITAVVGAHLLHLTLHPSPLIIVTVPAAVLPMAATGAAIGAYAKTHSQAGAFSSALTMLTVVLGGVLIPPRLLPPVLALTSNAVPIHYAASALNETLLGPVTVRLWFDLAVLAAFTMATFWLAGRRLRRRF
jgi:ABC-2 type transport system permease protein